MLSAYTTTAVSGASGSALLFEVNGASAGTGIAHTAGESDFLVLEPGIYTFAFHGNFAPASGANFPLNIIMTLQQDGVTVPGAVAQHTFHTSPDTATVSFSMPVEISTATSVFRIMPSGGDFTYSIVALTVYKVADLST